MNVPKYTVDLIRVLDSLYPDRMDIDDTDNDKDRYRLEGKVELIRQLKQSSEYIEETRDVSANPGK
jgi:hypothetical protein